MGQAGFGSSCQGSLLSVKRNRYNIHIIVILLYFEYYFSIPRMKTAGVVVFTLKLDWLMVTASFVGPWL